jgi:hypothetical protein
MREKKDVNKRKCTLLYMRIASIFFDKQDTPEMGVNRHAPILKLPQLPVCPWRDSTLGLASAMAFAF